jgi:hypothetical protein
VVAVRELKPILKQLLMGYHPFVLGRNPDRPAPAHVLNGFVASVLGYSPRGLAIVLLLRGKDTSVDDLRKKFGFASSEWVTDVEQLHSFRTDLTGIFDPDGRVFPTRGSPVLAHGGLATNDGSDDNFGPQMANLVSVFEDTLERRLETLFYPEALNDPVTATAEILVDGSTPSAKRSIRTDDRQWFRNDGAGQDLGSSLSRFVLRLMDQSESSSRLDTIQHLSRGLYLALILAIIYGPSAATRPEGFASVHELGPLVAWGGIPPGKRDHPFVRVSGRSFRNSMAELHAGLGSLLTEAIENQPVPSTANAEDRGAFAIQGLLENSGVPALKRKSYTEDMALVVSDPMHVGTRDWCDGFVARSHPEADLAPGVRTMGRKIGFVGPDRGAGIPRFGFETPLLGTLVQGLVPDEGMDYEDFVDTLRVRLGIVVGPGSELSLASDLGFWSSSGRARDALRQNQETLRRRLIRSGMAREYSDSHTEVVRAR